MEKQTITEEKFLLAFYTIVFLGSLFLLYFGFATSGIRTLIMGITVFFGSIYYVLSLNIIQAKLRDKSVIKRRTIFKWLSIIGAFTYIIYIIIY